MWEVLVLLCSIVIKTLENPTCTCSERVCHIFAIVFVLFSVLTKLQPQQYCQEGNVLCVSPTQLFFLF